MPAPIVYFEIGCKDTPKTSAFYSALLGWTMRPSGPVSYVDTGSKEGIQGHIASLGHPPHNYVVVYAQVDDIAASIAKAESLGGKKIVGPIEVPGQGTFAWISDPEGTTFGLWKALVK